MYNKGSLTIYLIGSYYSKVIYRGWLTSGGYNGVAGALVLLSRQLHMGECYQCMSKYFKGDYLRYVKLIVD